MEDLPSLRNLLTPFPRDQPQLGLHRFVYDLEQVSTWHSVYAPDDPSEMLDQFNHVFLATPISRVRIGHRRCPFVNMEIKELIGFGNRLLKCARRTVLQVDWSLYYDSRKVVKTKLRQAKESTFRNS